MPYEFAGFDGYGKFSATTYGCSSYSDTDAIHDEAKALEIINAIADAATEKASYYRQMANALKHYGMKRFALARRRYSALNSARYNLEAAVRHMKDQGSAGTHGRDMMAIGPRKLNLRIATILDCLEETDVLLNETFEWEK